MKMRKILSFVLVLSLVLGSFSMAFAATPSTGLSDIAGNANEDAIQVNADLGIITGFPDGTFLPEKAVTRAEFAAMITRAMSIPESALAGYTSTTFKDTAGYGWAVSYLAFCQSKGILIGDGQGNVMPGRTINVNEAMTMVLRAVGYVNHSSDLVGTWPANYVTVAQNEKLYDDVAAVATVDRASAAQIIYNALRVQKVAVNADGETKPSGANLLVDALGCTVDAGVVLDPSREAKINLMKYAGVYGDAYLKDGKVVAFTADSTTITGEVKANGTEVKVGDTTYKLKSSLTSSAAIATIGSVFVNGAVDTGVSKSFSDMAGKKFVTINADITGITINEVYSISTWVVEDAMRATKADIADLEDNEFGAYDFKTTEDDEIDMNSFTLVGVKNLSDIEVDDVAYIYTDGATSPVITKIAVGQKVVTGKVSVLDGKKFTVAGTVYQTASDAGIHYDGSVLAKKVAPSVKTDVELWLDAYGYVYDYKATSASADKYAVLVNQEIGAFDGDRVKLFLATDETKTFAIDDDATLTVPANGNLVAYGIDNDGEVEALDMATTVSAAKLTGPRTLYAGTTYYAVASDVVVFTTKAGAEYEVSSLGNVEINEQLELGGVFSFILNDDLEVVAMLVNADKASKSADDAYGVVNKVVDFYDDVKDKTVQKVTGFADGAALDKMTTESSTATGTKGAGLYKVVFDADGYIKSLDAPAYTSKGAVTFGNTTFAALNSTSDVVDLRGADAGMYDLATDVVVYERVLDGASFDKYVVSSVSKIRVDSKIAIYDTDDDLKNGYEVVIWEKI